MIDDHTPDFTGWARFSDDRVYRYRLARALTPRAAGRLLHRFGDPIDEDLKIVCFVMLNPSTADAFKLDPTVQRCAKFAARWGADALEVVNLFAFRSPHPSEMGRCGTADRAVWCHRVGVDSFDSSQPLWGDGPKLRFLRGLARATRLLGGGEPQQSLGFDDMLDEVPS